jgi:glutamine amidotransferase-like uncharacterized protein
MKRLKITGGLVLLMLFGVSAGVSRGAYAGTPRSYDTEALIYHGDATAYDDAEALAQIVESHGWKQKTVTSEELNAMSLDDMAKFGAILWPGGYASEMSDSLSVATRERIRKAVTERGVGFVGICAGAFIAVSPPAKAGEQGPNWGFAIIPEQTLDVYHLEDDGVEDAMVNVTFADGSNRDLLWWGGPVFPEYPHGVVARYSEDKAPALVQVKAGEGLVLLSGPHPESPENWRTKLGLNDKDGLDQDVAWNMIQAAVNQSPLPVLN